MIASGQMTRSSRTRHGIHRSAEVLATVPLTCVDYGKTASSGDEAKSCGGSFVSATAGPADVERSLAGRLGLSSGQIVQEIGYDDDCDDALRDSVAAVTGSELVDEEYDDVVDAVLLWWRDGDGDLVDALVDALTTLDDGGMIWLLTPKAGRDGHVEPSDIGEAAPTAGLAQTSTVSAAPDWSGTRLVTPRSVRGSRR